MSHGTLLAMKALPGQRNRVIEMFKRFDQEHPDVRGFERGIVVTDNNDPDRLMAGVRFDTTRNYEANSNDPQTDAWYRQLRSLLAEDPMWFDGTVLVEQNAPGIRR